jgi:hypothetical protein
VKASLRLASEAALPARNFNEATRDRRFFSRLAVPPPFGRPAPGNFVSRALSGPPSSPRTRPDLGARLRPIMAPGEVAEWSNAPHSKCGIGASLSGVRIPPSPPIPKCHGGCHPGLAASDTRCREDRLYSCWRLCSPPDKSKRRVLCRALLDQVNGRAGEGLVRRWKRSNGEFNIPVSRHRP